MRTKADFLQLAANLIGNYPSLQPLWQAKDPALLWMVESIAAMLGSLSAQLEVAALEPFDKVRDSTILADAAMRGIVPAAQPARWGISVKNNGSQPLRIETGRELLDSQGRQWITTIPADISPGATATLESSQYRTASILHIVDESKPLYAIRLPESDDGTYLCGVSVSDAAGEFEYRERFVNTLADERVFHLEANDRKQLYVRFGVGGVIGSQPEKGAEITITLAYSFGSSAQPDHGSPFSFAYIHSPTDNLLEMTASEALQQGQDPIGLDVMRDIARYPAVHDHNAVYLGEFDFLVRRKFPTLRFVNVWNERTEEKARGASLENVNRLHAAIVSQSASEKVVVYAGSPAIPLLDGELTEVQLAIREAVRAADDSYKDLLFYPALKFALPVTVIARISTNYHGDSVKAQIVDAIVGKYGIDSVASRRRAIPTQSDLYELLTGNVDAFKSGKSDLRLTIGEIPANVPELWVYADTSGIGVTIEKTNTIAPSWGY